MPKKKNPNPSPPTPPDFQSGSSRGPRCALMLIFASLMLLTTIYSASAQSAVPPSGSVDTGTFDQILQPVWKVYSFVKYIATAIATIFMVFAGITYMTSGNDMTKRDNAKHTIGYVVVGLIVIWAAPYVVQMFAA